MTPITPLGNKTTFNLLSSPHNAQGQRYKKSPGNLHLDCASILKYVNEFAMERANPASMFKISVEGHGSRLLCWQTLAVVNTQVNVQQIQRPEGLDLNILPVG